jgi:hypothetical protein
MILMPPQGYGFAFCVLPGKRHLETIPVFFDFASLAPQGHYLGLMLH